MKLQCPLGSICWQYDSRCDKSDSKCHTKSSYIDRDKQLNDAVYLNSELREQVTELKRERDEAVAECNALAIANYILEKQYGGR